MPKGVRPEQSSIILILSKSNDHLTSLAPRSPRNDSNSRNSFSFSSSNWLSLNVAHLKTVALGNCASFFLSKAYDLREELSAIFDAKQSKESARRAITNWTDKVKRSGLKCIDSFLVKLDNWLDEITNYFLDPQTSGLQEGFNNKIKVLKRRCYGITNISHLFQRIWLDLEGFKLFGV